MDIQVNVANQKLKIATNLKTLVEGTQEFVRFVFNLNSDWDNLLTFAQFRQNGKAYNQFLDEDNSAFLPVEIGTGSCTLMLYGSNENTIATTNFLTLTIDENILVSDANSTEISESLYTQLVTKVNILTNQNKQNVADLIAADKELQRQINTKATDTDLTTEILRAKAAEKVNADTIALKADQMEVDELTIKVTQLESNEVVAQLIQDAVTSEMQEFLSNGTLANMTIQDNSISRSKVNSIFEQTLTKADTAMQPSVFDPQNLKVDIYAYAQGKADTVQSNLNTVKSEIQDAYELTETLKYKNLGDTIRGAVTLSKSYAQALLSDYKAFTIKIVDELPIIGETMTFYLIPNNSNTGYDKYWWIVDSVGDAKWDVFGNSSTLIVTELPVTGEEDIDYILKSRNGCLYYKWIDGMWQVIAGSIANVSSALPQTGNEFTDYYVLNESGNYVHYRYINGNFYTIGSNAYTKEEINEKIATINESLASLQQMAENNIQQIETNTTNIGVISRAVDNVHQDLNSLNTFIEIDVLEIPSTTEDITLISSGNPKTNKLNLKKVIINARLLLPAEAGTGLVLRVRTDGGGRYLTYKTSVTAVNGGILYNAIAEFDETTGITNTNMSLLRFASSQGTSPSDMNLNYKSDTVKTPINDIEIFVLSGNENVPILAGSSVSIKGVLA